MTRAIASILAAAALCSAARSTGAHHSTAEFDYSKTVVLRGKVKELQWMNPHSNVQLLVDTLGTNGVAEIDTGGAGIPSSPGLHMVDRIAKSTPNESP
jgi:hypothetical protein